MPLSWGFWWERVTRIELALSAWEADVLPLNYTRAARAEAQARGLSYRNRRRASAYWQRMTAREAAQGPREQVRRSRATGPPQHARRHTRAAGRAPGLPVR